MISKKKPTCKLCGGEHYATFCFSAPKKQMQTRKPLGANRTLKYTLKLAKPLKQPVLRPHSKSERTRLIKKADKVFSEYVRRRDLINGVAFCVTCAEKGDWRRMHNGHYISRRKLSTRWDEKNAHCQCPYCNVNLAGNLGKYKEYLVKRYGNKILAYLEFESNRFKKYTLADIQDIVELYTAKLQKLK